MAVLESDQVWRMQTVTLRREGHAHGDDASLAGQDRDFVVVLGRLQVYDIPDIIHVQSHVPSGILSIPLGASLCDGPLDRFR